MSQDIPDAEATIWRKLLQAGLITHGAEEETESGLHLLRCQQLATARLAAKQGHAPHRRAQPRRLI